MYIITFIVFGLIIFLGYNLIKYRNPYKLFMVFGRKGSGKTTLMNKLAQQYLKKGWTVFSDTDIPGCYQFDIKEFGLIMFPENSLILIDEVNLIWDNRDFKTFPKHVAKYFRLQRKYKHTVYLFSQTFDVDKKIRDLCDHLYLVQNFMNCFSVARRVTKHITIVHADKSAQGESKIVDDYRIDSIFASFFGGIRITYIPRWAKYFKSFDPPMLQQKQFNLTPYPEHLKDPKKIRFKKTKKEEMNDFLKQVNKSSMDPAELDINLDDIA